MNGPLTGTLVLDLSQGIAGPYCGMLLAEMGARVVKVEPPTGDWMRSLGRGVDGASASFLYYNRGKEGIALDLDETRGQDAARTLAARADVLIENMRPGSLAKRGLGYDDMAALNPSLVYLSISGFGLSGPKAARPMTDTFGQAFSGLMHVNRAPDGTPVKIGTTLVDAFTGLYAAQAVMRALWPGGGERRGQHLDVSLVQSVAAAQGPKILDHALADEPAPLLNAPAGVYATKDGWLALTIVNERQWQALCRVLGLGDLAGDPRMQSFEGRGAHIDILHPAVAGALAAEPTGHWEDALTEASVMACGINDYGDWLADPQVQAIEAAPEGRIAGRALPLARTPGQPLFEAPPPAIGEHGAALAAEFGLDPSEPETST